MLGDDSVVKSVPCSLRRPAPTSNMSPSPVTPVSAHLTPSSNNSRHTRAHRDIPHTETDHTHMHTETHHTHTHAHTHNCMHIRKGK